MPFTLCPSGFEICDRSRGSSMGQVRGIHGEFRWNHDTAQEHEGEYGNGSRDQESHSEVG